MICVHFVGTMSGGDSICVEQSDILLAYTVRLVLYYFQLSMNIVYIVYSLFHCIILDVLLLPVY